MSYLQKVLYLCFCANLMNIKLVLKCIFLYLHYHKSNKLTGLLLLLWGKEGSPGLGGHKLKLV
jgi:hypothetical protein